MFRKYANYILALVFCVLLQSCGSSGRSFANSSGYSVADDAPIATRMKHVKQPIGSNWCWAACTEMVGNYYRRPQPQVKLVSKLWGKKGDPRKSAIALGLTSFPPFHLVTNKDPRLSGRALSFNKIQKETKSGRPVAWGYGPPTGPGHIVLIVGTSVTGGKQEVVVFDPKQRSGRPITYSYKFYANNRRDERHRMTYYDLEAL